MSLRFILGLLFPVVLFIQTKDLDVSTHLQRAAEAERRRDLKVAAQEYSKVVSLDPNNAEAHARLGMVYQDLGMLSKAADSLKGALQLDPSLPRVGILLALVYTAQGKNRDAVPYLEQAFGSNEERAIRFLAGRHLVDCHFAVGETEKGLAVAERLRQLAPDDPDVLYTSSKVYANLWKIAVERLIAKTPDSYRVHQILAEVFEAQDRFPEAAKEYRLIIEREPQLPGVHYRLGRMILRSDSTAKGDQEALAEFQKELQLNPLDVSTHTEMGELCLRMQRLEEAAQHFSKATEIQSSHVRARIGMAKVFIAKKEFQKGVQELNETLRSAPDDESAYYHLMIAYRSLGRAAEAKMAFDRFESLKKRRQEIESSTLSRLKGARIQVSGPDP